MTSFKSLNSILHKHSVKIKLVIYIMFNVYVFIYLVLINFIHLVLILSFLKLKTKQIIIYNKQFINVNYSVSLKNWFLIIISYL